MRFLISVIDDLTGSGTPEEIAAINKFNDQLRDDGHWVFACGLDSPSTATVIDNRSGRNEFTPKPLFEAKENYSGFWIIEAPTLDKARQLAFEGSKSCNRKVELRPLLG